MLEGQPSDRCLEVNAAVRALAIVDAEPSRQCSVSLFRGLVRNYVSPLLLKGFDEALRLSFGLRRIGLPQGAEAQECSSFSSFRNSEEDQSGQIRRTWKWLHLLGQTLDAPPFKKKSRYARGAFPQISERPKTRFNVSLPHSPNRPIPPNPPNMKTTSPRFGSELDGA